MTESFFPATESESATVKTLQLADQYERALKTMCHHFSEAHLAVSRAKIQGHAAPMAVPRTVSVGDKFTIHTAPPRVPYAFRDASLQFQLALEQVCELHRIKSLVAGQRRDTT